MLPLATAACDPPPPGSEPAARPAPSAARTPVRAAAPTSGRQCPSRNFAGFVARFAEDPAVQERFTRFPVEDVSFEYGVDEQGREDTDTTIRYLSRADVRRPLLPPRPRREADSLAMRVDTAGRPWAVLYKPDTDYQVVYMFARAAGCWELVRVEDQSL